MSRWLELAKRPGWAVAGANNQLLSFCSPLRSNRRLPLRGFALDSTILLDNFLSLLHILLGLPNFFWSFSWPFPNVPHLLFNPSNFQLLAWLSLCLVLA